MLEVNAEKCQACGECETVCSFQAIRVENGLAVVDRDLCTLCGVCVEACPEDALQLSEAEAEGAMDPGSWRGVWVAAECRGRTLAPVSRELLGKARELAEGLEATVTAVIMGHGVAPLGRELIAYGADRVLVADHPALASFTDEPYGSVLASLAKAERPEIILAGATSMGRSYIPRVATLLETGLTADCTELAVRGEDRALLQTRPAWGGNLLATIVCPGHRPQMATVRPHVMKAMPPDPDRKGEIVQVTLKEELLRQRVRVLESVKEEAEGPNLCEAEVIVTAGRGIEKEQHLAWLLELARLLGGAVGATRAATDAGWLSHRCQIGQTGTTVSPKLYIGCGVSGAIQHIVGMQGSEIVVAINKDPEAPIFDVATYGIVGDVKKVIPLLINRIRKERES